jgi:hypothetical protein
MHRTRTFGFGEFMFGLGSGSVSEFGSGFGFGLKSSGSDSGSVSFSQLIKGCRNKPKQEISGLLMVSLRTVKYMIQKNQELETFEKN